MTRSLQLVRLEEPVLHARDEDAPALRVVADVGGRGDPRDGHLEAAARLAAVDGLRLPARDQEIARERDDAVERSLGELLGVGLLAVLVERVNLAASEGDDPQLAAAVDGEAVGLTELLPLGEDLRLALLDRIHR